MFTLPDFETNTETDEMGCTEFCGSVHTTQRHISPQIPIEFCVTFIGVCVSLCLCVWFGVSVSAP